MAGLALIEAVQATAPAAPLLLKWPNDLMLGDGKLAGILLERSGDRVVAGFGVNLAGAPPIEGRQTSALKPYAEIAPADFATLLAERFARLLEAWRAAERTAFAQAWQARAHAVGTPLTVHLSANERISGRFEGIDPDGAMRLRLDDGRTEVIRAGDVSLG